MHGNFRIAFIYGQYWSYCPPTSGNMTIMAVDKSDTEIAMH